MTIATSFKPHPTHGFGSAGGTGNSANYMSMADWNGQNGSVTTVGTNGAASAYGAFDISGNVFEWSDLTGAAGSRHGLWGGYWFDSVLDCPPPAGLRSPRCSRTVPPVCVSLPSPNPAPA